MALPETTLSNPLLDALYAPFLEVYAGVRPPTRSEVDRAARQLTSFKGAPSPDIIRRHQTKDTPHLADKGRMSVPFGVALDYLEVVSGVVKDQEDSMRKWVQSLSASGEEDPPPLPPLALDTIHTSMDLVLRLQDALYWLNVVDQIVQASKAHTWTMWNGGWFSRRVSLVPCKGEFLMCTTDVCLMMKDMMYSRFIIPLYCHIDPSRSHLTRKLAEFEQWGKDVLLNLGNDGYDVIKGIESLTQTALIQREEAVLDGTLQHTTMLSKYKEKEVQAGGSGRHVDQLSDYLDSFQTSRDLAEAFGFLKLWGHPYVDPYAGCTSVQGLAKQDLNLRVSDCLKLEWSFCHLYCRGYLQKNSRWPKLEFVDRGQQGPTKLQRLYESNHPSLAFGFTQYEATDWQWVKFGNHLQFDEGDDILSLVVDKSISHSREFFDSTWGGKLPYKPPRSPTSTRVMEELVSRPAVDLREIVDRVASRDIPRAWKIVSVCPKEREMKKHPRMFSMMVLEMRLFFVLTEHNIAEGVFRSMPEQTMTLNRQELLDLFLQSTRPVPGSWVRLVLGIDFSKWNTMWRKETVHPIGRRMDQMYGKPGVFSVVHDFFEESMCLLRLPEYPPEHLSANNRHSPPEGRSLWYKHKGGFEGIAQKLWTAATIALIHLALWKLGLSYRIVGQGDNQVCIIEVYVPPTVGEDKVKEYVRDLATKASEAIAEVGRTVGQIVKPEECISSTCFFTYGKEMILNGAYLPTSLKYVSRMFPSTTSDAPSLYEMVSSISSGASGATERNDWSYPTYYLAKLMEGITLKRELTRSLFHGSALRVEAERLSGPRGGEKWRERMEEILLLLLSVPSNLGGLPITTLPEIMYRGHSDPLSSSLLHLDMLSGLRVVEQYKKVVLKGWLLKKTPELTGLIQDPYSIPLEGGMSPSGSVASVTSSILQKITRNVQFKEILDRSTQDDRKKLDSWIGTMRPFYPKIAHDLYKCSLSGVRDGFAKRFSNTRTLLNISRKAEVDVAGVSLTADLSYMKRVLFNMHLVWKVGEEATSYTRQGIYNLAVTLRKCWLGGVHLEGVTSAHPLAVSDIRWIPRLTPLPDAACRIVVAGLSSNSHGCTSTRGSVVPYMGSSTSEKAVAKWVKPIESSPPLRDVLKILSIRAMVSIPGSSFYSSLTELAQTRSLMDVSTLAKLVQEKVGGVIAHRYSTRDDPRGTFWNSCFNWPSHVTISSNLAGKLGSSDYPFSFQEAFVSASTLLCWLFSRQSVEAPWGLCLDVDLDRMAPVGDHIVSSDLYSSDHSTPPNNYYASVLNVKLSSRAHQSARLAQVSLPSTWEVQSSPVTSALGAVFLSVFRSSHPITSRYGHSIGVPSPKRVVDLPEVGLLSTDQAVEGLVLSLWMKVGLATALISGRGERKPGKVFTTLLDLEARRGIPALMGTLREVDGGNPLYGLGVGMGREGEADALARWMYVAVRKALEGFPGGRFTVFERGGSSVSSLLSSWLGILACQECLTGDEMRIRNGKMLARMVKKAMEGPDETGRVRVLAAIVKVGDMSSMFKVDPTSPEEVLRALRGTNHISPEPTSGRVRRVYTPPVVHTRPVGGTARLVLPLQPIPPSDLLDSWITRSQDFPSAAERWSPLASLHREVRKVLMVGVGSGDIGGAIPRGWEVVGLDLASSLQSLGQSFTTYRPPGLSGAFSIHPLSWTTSGDVTSQGVLDQVRYVLQVEKFDLCILDIEGVDNHTRLRVRQALAESSVPTYCKVLLSSSLVENFLASWSAYRHPSDVLWTTLSYPGREFVVGSSEAPIGMYAAVPSHDLVLPDVTAPSLPDFYVSGYPAYTPGPDLLLLTGHLPHKAGLGSIKGYSLRGLFPYLEKERLQDLHSLKEICLMLLDKKCPRRRIKALIRLEVKGYLVTAWKLQLQNRLLW